MKDARLTPTRFLLTFKNSNGQGLVEYSLILLLIAIVIFATLRAFGTTVRTNLYEPINSSVTGAGSR